MEWAMHTRPIRLPFSVMKTFGLRVRAARHDRGLSQERLARLVDTSKNSVQNWERNSSLPRCETVVAIAQALEVSADYLLGLSPADLTDARARYDRTHAIRDRA